jgi:tetratricopeptide (TPR) repeat protein
LQALLAFHLSFYHHDPVKPLESPDTHHLQAAIGWLELGNITEANEELENIAPTLRAHPDVLEVRWQIFAKAKKWDLCVDIAGTIIKLDAKRPSAWIQRSFALHEMKKTQMALEQLVPAAESFPKVWTIPYNLACYCAQLGRLDECKEWFKKAVVIDERSVQRMALDDPDLKPLWDSMSGTFWKRVE